MKINYPSTHDGWVKLGKDIIARSKKLDGEAPIGKADADLAKLAAEIETAKENFDKADKFRKSAEEFTEKRTQSLADAQNEIRRAARVLTGRYINDRKSMGKWGFTIDETSAAGPAQPPPAQAS